MSLAKRLFDNFDQIVIYGAKGWFGRSAVSAVMQENPVILENQILLIGSKSESGQSADLPWNVYSSADALKLIRSNSLFLNSAYLRREKLNLMSEKEYEAKNQEILEFGISLIKAGKVKTFLNLSSGVASQGSMKALDKVKDSYARGKIRDEALLISLCESTKTELVNCRIYSMSGKFINEFENLALSSFINQASDKAKEIIVKSPSTKRTYVDSIDLARVLLEMACKGGSVFLDSGGTLTTFGEIATGLASLIPGVNAILPSEFEKSPDYYGDYERFNQLASECGVKLLDLDQQIMETRKAFIKD